MGRCLRNSYLLLRSSNYVGCFHDIFFLISFWQTPMGHYERKSCGRVSSIPSFPLPFLSHIADAHTRTHREEGNRKMVRTVYINFIFSVLASTSSAYTALTFWQGGFFAWYAVTDYMWNSVCLFLMLASNRRIVLHALCCCKKTVLFEKTSLPDVSPPTSARQLDNEESSTAVTEKTQPSLARPLALAPILLTSRPPLHSINRPTRVRKAHF